MNTPTEVKIRCVELICNDFGLLCILLHPTYHRSPDSLILISLLICRHSRLCLAKTELGEYIDFILLHV